MKLPPLDPSDVHDESGLATYYTADQLRDYGIACAEAMREECASIVESYYDTPLTVATKIRGIEVER